jgi:metallophosphoesterase superfamily enzyme
MVASPHRFLWHGATRTAILSDLHLGAEQSLARQGLYLPPTSWKAILGAWERVVALDPAHLILAGDVCDAPEDTGLEELAMLLERRPKNCRVTLTPGNHDPEVAVFAERFPFVTMEPFTKFEGITVAHGHALPTAGSPRALITGHQHPAVVLATRVQAAKMICFAQCVVGKGRMPLMILPAFSPLPLGSNLLTERNWILDLPRPVDAAVRIYGIIEKAGKFGEGGNQGSVLDFGPLSGLMGNPR